jgi:hypothetical protein
MFAINTKSSLLAVALVGFLGSVYAVPSVAAEWGAGPLVQQIEQDKAQLEAQGFEQYAQ